MAETTFDLDGYYAYNTPNPSDSGHTSFSLIYNPVTSSVSGSGKDNAGPFTIVGIFDGLNLRWIKKYPSWEWVYLGKAVDLTCGPTADSAFAKAAGVHTSYRFVGGWGNGKSQFGTFVLNATQQNTVDAHLTGVWSGNYYYNGQPGRIDAPMKLFLAILPNRDLHGEGEDQWGAFTVDGNIQGARVHMKKVYASGVTWAYDGQLEGTDKISGNWGDGRTAMGTFTFNKGAVLAASGVALAKQVADKAMPPTSQLWGKLADVSESTPVNTGSASSGIPPQHSDTASGGNWSGLAKPDVDKLLWGFSTLK